MKIKLLFCFCLSVIFLSAQPHERLKKLDTIPVRMDMPFETNDVVINGKQIVLAATQVEREAKGYGNNYTPWLICLDEQLRYQWKKKADAPFSNAGTTAITATSDNRVFVAMKEKYNRSCVQEINAQGDSLRNIYLDNPCRMVRLLVIPGKKKKNKSQPVGEINMQGDTIWYSVPGLKDVPGNQVDGTQVWITTHKKVDDAVIKALYVCKDGRIIAAGKAGCGIAQCIYPAEKRTACMLYESTEHDGWSEITGVAETGNGFVLSATIGTRQARGMMQQSCMLVFTDRELRETRRVVLNTETRSENHCIVSDGKRLISGGSDPDRHKKASNYIAITDTTGNKLCTKTWGEGYWQDDVSDVAVLSSGKIAALHQLGKKSALTIFSQCDSLQTFVFKNTSSIEEKPVAMKLLPDGNMLVVTRGNDYLDELYNSVQLTWIRKVSPELKVIGTQILLYTSGR